MKMLTLALLAMLILVLSPSASAAPTGRYTLVAMTMVRWDVASAEAYFSDHGTYAGMTVAKLRYYDRTLSTVEVVRASRSGYCLQTNVLGSWAHYAGPSANVRAGRC